MDSSQGNAIAPNYGFGTSRRQTLSILFGGKPAAERNHDPLFVMSRHAYHPRLQGWFGAGTGDIRHLAVAHRLEAAARRSGIEVHRIVEPGGHSWTYAGRAFAKAYPSLVRSLSPAHARPRPRYGPSRMS
jgi:S-formylglutathione hydrolase FrmB